MRDYLRSLLRLQTSHRRVTNYYRPVTDEYRQVTNDYRWVTDDYRRVTDDYIRVTDDSQTTTDESQTTIYKWLESFSEYIYETLFSKRICFSKLSYDSMFTKVMETLLDNKSDNFKFLTSFLLNITAWLTETLTNITLLLYSGVWTHSAPLVFL